MENTIKTESNYELLQKINKELEELNKRRDARKEWAAKMLEEVRELCK